MSVPARPAHFHPHGAPVGVEIKLDAYRSTDGGEWWPTRPVISPRLQLVHTNGATGEGSIESAINWGNSSPYRRTHPHYQVDRGRAAKLVPTDRRGIGNATKVDYRGEHGNVSDWSIVIETSDLGYPTPGEDGGFITPWQIEMVATILAYEGILYGIPLSYPTEWYGAGTACHTEPFGHPYWTLHSGKVCPGRTRKQQMREIILPRAIEIANAWTTDEDDDMTPLDIPERIFDSRETYEFRADETRTIPVGSTESFLHVTLVSSTPGYVSISGSDTRSKASLVNADTQGGVATGGAPIRTPDGSVRVHCSGGGHIIIDVYARGGN